MKKIFHFCRRYLLLYKWRLTGYVSISILGSLSALISPYIIGDFIDQLLAAQDMRFIYRYFAIFATINLFALIFGYIGGRLYVRLQSRIGYALNRDFIQRLQRAPLKFTQQQDTVYLNQRINNDANSLVIFCISIIQSMLVNGVMIIVPAALLFYFHPMLAAILLVVAVVYFVFYTLYKRVLYKANYEYKESQSRFFAKLNEQMFNIRFIKLHGLFDHFIGRLNTSFHWLLGSALRHQRASYVFNGLDKLVMMVSQMILLLFGGVEIIAGRLTIGQFIIISAYFNMMLGALRYFFSLGQTVQSNMVAYDRLQELAQINPEPNGGQALTAIDKIELKNVTFAYGNQPLIDNFNLQLQRGKICAIMGANGKGKSTLVDIILGLQAGSFTGHVFYNGVPMEAINMYAVRNRLIGVSEQEPTLLSDTLSYNLDLDKEGLAAGQMDKVNNLVRMLGLSECFKSLPYDAIINENAANISGGEKQKISILRALLKNPDVLVLDEPTSALDAASCAALKTYLQALKHYKIIIVVTHDKTFVNDDDTVVLLG